MPPLPRFPSPDLPLACTSADCCFLSCAMMCQCCSMLGRSKDKIQGEVADLDSTRACISLRCHSCIFELLVRPCGMLQVRQRKRKRTVKLEGQNPDEAGILLVLNPVARMAATSRGSLSRLCSLCGTSAKEAPDVIDASPQVPELFRSLHAVLHVVQLLPRRRVVLTRALPSQEL